VLDDIEDAAEAAEELVGRGRDAWDEDRLLLLAGEAVIGRTRFIPSARRRRRSLNTFIATRCR